MRLLAIIVFIFSPFYALAEAPEVSSGVSGPYFECQLQSGEMEYTPALVCKNKGGKESKKQIKDGSPPLLLIL